MEWLIGLVLLVVFAVGWWVMSQGKTPSPPSSSPPKATSATPPKRSTSRNGAKRVIVAIPETPIDLRHPTGITCAVQGISHWTTPAEKQRFNEEVFYLRREPTNVHDENAVAVYGGQQKFGYLSADRAKRYAPVLDQMGEAFIVSRDLTRPRMSFILPPIRELRTRAKGTAGQDN